MKAISSVPVQVALTCREYFLGALPDEVIHDRQVMWRKIPDDIHVMLKQPQIYARRVVIVQFAQSAFL